MSAVPSELRVRTVLSRAVEQAPRRVVALLGLLAVLGLVAAVVIHVRDGPDVINLNKERGLPAVASASVLLAAAICTASASRHGSLSGVAGRTLAAVLALMAADELLELHETLETRTGVDWQVLYAPVVLLAGLAWAALLRDLLERRPPGWEGGTSFLVLGAVAWGLSQVLEAAQWQGDDTVAGFGFYVVPEELGELCGSGLFLLAALVLLSDRQPTA